MPPTQTDIPLIAFTAAIAGLRLVQLGRSWLPRANGRRAGSVAVAGIALAAALAGAGAYATFTSVASQSQSVSSGTVAINLGATGAATNRLNISASGIVAGDTMQRSVDVNTGSADLSGITLTTSASPSSLLDTDTTNGLQVAIDKCSSAWTEAGTSPAYTYTCGGTTSTVLASRAVIGTNITLSNMTFTASATNHLRVTLTLPSASANTTQGLSSTIQYDFIGSQRAATNK
jgi:spore coat-associated protein N